MSITQAVSLRFVLVFSLVPAWAAAQSSARVESFTPQGTVKAVRQVRARFSEAMVPFGDPRSVAPPFEMDCPVKGTPRWADSRHWVFDFAQDLEAGLRCEFRLRTGLKSLAGNEVTGTRRFAFSTGGPAIKASRPWQGNEQIDEEQIFVLELDAAVDESSALANASFTVEGIASRVGVRVVSGAERDQILNSEYRWRPERPKHVLLLQARQRFPNGTKVSLVWGRGIRTPSGVANDKDQVLPFAVRPTFTATFRCQRENAEAQCVPISPMQLSFSSSVAWADVKDAVLKGPGGRQWKAKLESRGYDEEAYVNSVAFEGPFPERSTFTLEIPAGLKDDAGRPLTNASSFPITVRTDEYPPLAKFAAEFGILELKGGALLPVTLRNVEPSVPARVLDVVEGQVNLDPVVENPEQRAVNTAMRGRILKVPSDYPGQMFAWIRKVSRRNWEDRDKSIFGPATKPRARAISIPKPSGAKAFEVIGIPLKSPGFYVVEIESEILGAHLLSPPRPMYVAAAALVTNLAVHVKRGIDASLIWVTALDTGRPVAGAEVVVRYGGGKLLWQGKTDASGIARPDTLPVSDESSEEDLDPDDRALLVTARLGDDLSFTHTSWQDGIEPWRFRLPQEWNPQPIFIHTVFDRPLFRAGETVHMKHFLRERTSAGLRLATGRAPGNIVVRHLGSDQKYELPLKWETAGVAESTWKIPAEAKLGDYMVGYGRNEATSGNFRVEEFRLPLMRAVIRPPSAQLVSPASIPLDMTVTFLAGGAAANLPVRLRYQIQPYWPAPADGLEGFTFSNGRVREGTTRRGMESDEEESSPRAPELHRTDLTLDKAGSARFSITSLPMSDIPRSVLAELEYRDPNGEAQTVASRIPLWPSERLVGIQPDSWTLSKESLKLRSLVTDLSGKPVPNAPVRIELFERKTYSHRKRLVGGFYAYEHTTEQKRLSTLCEGKTDRLGQFYCERAAPTSGNLIVQAVTRDSAGRESAAHQDVWVAGSGDWWFRAEDGDRMDLVPETRRYEPGDKAKFQVRMPFRKATALVTIEREGVVDAFVRELSGKQPVIEVPMKGNYAPNVFVSVLAVRGRVSEVKATATVDLGRPACKLGIAEVRVGWREHELKVRVAADRPAYRVREKAQVSVAVTTADGRVPPLGAEIAVAAVDEGLLELLPNESWKLLDSMMGRRRYGVSTSTGQLQVIGKRHFGLKALPQGGGGGRQLTRELFDTLLLWKGRIPVDAQGKASVEVPLNDSITSFRIVAIASAGADRFGTGSTSIRSTQDLMLFSGVPPVAREGDRLRPEFTVRNASARPMTVRVVARIEGFAEQMSPVDLQLAPGESRPVAWEITVPTGVDSLKYAIEADAGEAAHDRLAVSQRVAPVVPVRTLQATLTRAEPEARLDVAIPAGALPGRGGVQVSLRPKLADGLAGIAEYMKLYPYSCLEQLVSRAVALHDQAHWKDLMTALPYYLDSEGLARYFPVSHLDGSDTLTAYVLSIAHEAGWTIPTEERNKMLSGLLGFTEGRISRWSRLPTADLAIRKVAALAAVSRYQAIQPALLGSIPIEPNLWPTSAALDWLAILRRTPAIRDRDAQQGAVEQILRSRLNFQGTTMGFSSERTDFCWWLMASGDSNSVRLILSQLDSASWKEDLPRVVRGALGRMRRGHWDTTTANAWGVLAMDKFSRSFENTPVTGQTRVGLAGAVQSVDWSSTPKGGIVSFAWPARPSTLSVAAAGTGSPWVTVQSLAAVPLREPLSTGYSIRKSYLPVEQKEQGIWSRGDIVRVRLELEAQSDMTWVVVSDPVPAGASILGTGLGRDSALSTQGERREGWVWPAFEERSLEAFRSYFEFVPKGKWTVEYTMRLNSEGTMNLPNTRVEAMYSPEMFGEIPNAPLRIR